MCWGWEGKIRGWEEEEEDEDEEEEGGGLNLYNYRRYLGIYGYVVGCINCPYYYRTCTTSALGSFLPLACWGCIPFPSPSPYRQQRGGSGKAQEHRLGRERGVYVPSAWAGTMIVSKKLTEANADARGLERRVGEGGLATVVQYPQRTVPL